MNTLKASSRLVARLSSRPAFPIHSRQMASFDVSGMYPPITTPFDNNENINWEKLNFNLEKWEKIPFRGYVVQGSNGEYAYMSDAERVDMVARVKSKVSKDKLVIAGSGCESTRSTIKMTKSMADAGADAVLVVTPCFYKSGMTGDAMLAHFTKVADESPVPIILYSVPANTGIDLSAEVIIKLSQHPNIVGLKDSGGDIAKLGYVVHKTKGNSFQVLAGSASFLYPAFSVGCVGGVVALANALGDQCCQVESLFKAGKLDEAKALQYRLIAPNLAVTRKYGVPGLKRAMEWFGFYGGPVRNPLQELSSDVIDKVKQDFADNELLP